MSTIRRIEHGSISALVKSASYAVRGPIVARSAELAQKLQQGSQLPFKKIVACNIGNPHSLNQKPLSYMRDVLSLVLNPSLRDRVHFKEDVVARAEKYLAAIPGMGAYTESQGILSVREDISKFLMERDGHKANPSNIFVTNGASEGVRLCMQTIIRDPTSGFKDGILTPIPQYPMYSALTTLLQGNLVPYYLDEGKGWSCSVDSLRQSLAAAEQQGITSRALVVINPGNPTGQVLTEEEMRSIIEFCRAERVCLMADEVYQENIWHPGKRFISFRKVAKDMGAFDDTENGLQLISFHSISKGFLGECGLRGGFFELLGIPADVKQEILKLASISLCSNTVGQVATGLMVQPPKSGDASYAEYARERDEILQSLRRRADLLSGFLNTLDGVTCNTIEGAMYAFPSITLPAKAVQAAVAKGAQPDALYCEELLESTGIVVVPGSGFGQVDGTFHFRTTILPSEEDLQEVVRLLSAFHTEFLRKYK